MDGPLRWRRRVAEIEATASPGGRARSGCSSLEGLRLFERALRAGATIEAALASDEFLEDESERVCALRSELEAQSCELLRVPDEVLAKLTEGRSLGGIVGLARLPEALDLSAVLAAPAARPALLLACVGSNDPGNVGALVRTAHASGASALLTAGSTDAFHPRAVRTSMGSLFRLPVVSFPDLETLAGALRAAGVQSLGAVSEGGVPLARVAPTDQPRAVVVGSEAFGLGPAERALLDLLFTIPMAAGVDSFSVNAAAAVALYGLGASGGMSAP